MTAPVFGPGYTQWVGQAPESVYGTAQTVPTFWTPADSPKYTANLKMLVDGALRGSQAAEYQQVPGMQYDQVTYKTYFYLDSVFLFMRQLFGGVDVPTGAGPYTHTTSLQNSSNNAQPTGTTLFFNVMDKTKRMPGAILQEAKITLKSEELATIELTYIGLPSTDVTAPTNTPTTAIPMPTWNSTITLGGSATNRYSELDLDYKRETKPIDVINGTQAPGAIFAGPVTVSGNLTAVFAGSTDVDWVNYLTNVQPALVSKTAPVGDAVNSITFQHSKIGYDQATYEAGADYFEIKSNIRGLAQATDATAGGLSPAKVTLVSSVSTAI